ncbi:MAG: four helix bundle protein [Pyrinomonadaceae bacterium]
MCAVIIKSHRDLIVWQKSMDLAQSVYELTRCFPKEETYGLLSQTRRAVTSIPANIAEGQGRRSKREFQQFLGHARGSLLELDTHLELALRFRYISHDSYQIIQPRLQEVGRLLNGLLRSLND